VRFSARKNLLLSGVISGPKTRALRRSAHWARRKLTNATRQVEFFYQVDDPYSHLCAQVLPALLERHEITLVPRLVLSPEQWATPDRGRWVSLSRVDAARYARGYGLSFSDPGKSLDPELVDRVSCLLAGVRDPRRFAELAVQAGEALWGDDADAIAALEGAHSVMELGEARALMSANASRRSRLGHYLGATFYHEGEWYLGPDRIHHLEERLMVWGGAEAVAPLLAPREPGELEGAQALPGATLEAFVSLRSPYSYIALGRAWSLARRLDVEFVLRPVLPMVMRGLEVPMAKRIYLLCDARREAERLGIKFGRVADPLGGGIEQAFSLLGLAREHDRLPDYFLSCAQAVFHDELDLGDLDDLRKVVERVGLVWPDAQRWLGRQDWRGEIEQNRQELLELGAWGVPSFKVGEQVFWGQDRLWLVERALCGEDV